jgi:hypothetical protein
MNEKRNAYRFLMGKCRKKRDHLEDPDVGRRIILKYM